MFSICYLTEKLELTIVMKGNEGICLGNDPECNENSSWAIIQLNLDDESSGDNRPHGRVQRSCNQAGRAKCVFVENFEVAFIGSLQNLPKCNSISDHFNPFWIISPFFETKSINLASFLRFSFFRADNSRPARRTLGNNVCLAVGFHGSDSEQNNLLRAGMTLPSDLLRYSVANW